MAASFELTPADYPTIVRSLADYQSGAAPTRLLRRYDDDEERAIGGGASKLVDKLVNKKAYEVQAAKTLKLEYIDDHLTSSNIKNLVNQVKEFNSKNTIKVSLVGTLTTKYGDQAVATALVTAERSTKSSSIVEQFRTLRNEQLVRWKKDGKSVADVSTLLNFGNNRDLGQKFQVLDNYVTLVKKSDETLLRSLIKGVGVKRSWRATSSATKEKAQRLENSLISKWSRQGQLPSNVHQWLKLYENVDDAFSADNLNRFMKYVDDFNVKNPTNEKPVIGLYTKAFGDAVVAKKLVSAMDDPATSTAAKKLQVESWIKNEKSVDDVLAMLKIDIGERSSIVNQKVNLLEQFVTVKGADQNVIKTLTDTNPCKGFGENGATTLQKKQFATWIDDKVTPKNFMSRVFNTVLNSASEEQKAIAAKFNAFYQTRG
ncbi:hypothetical protein GQ600_356 [Phytophthora cactorum]|nr:hypothetical protein GQ600_356 [Phytophthora cactorum]